jgi:hypothetical protein
LDSERALGLFLSASAIWFLFLSASALKFVFESNNATISFDYIITGKNAF